MTGAQSQQNLASRDDDRANDFGQPVFGHREKVLEPRSLRKESLWLPSAHKRHGSGGPWRSDRVAVSVPAIVSPMDFQTVQTRLSQRRPPVSAPRIVNSNVL